MQSNLRLNSRRKENLHKVLIVLFPEYKYIIIKNNGFIKFKKYRLSCGKKVHLNELIFSEISKRLSLYRGGHKDYNEIYNNYFVDIISSNQCNIVDFLYNEFIKLKTTSKTEILLERSQCELTEAPVNIVTIGEVVKRIIPCMNIKNKFTDTLSLLKRRESMETVSDRYNRLLFITTIGIK